MATLDYSFVVSSTIGDTRKKTCMASLRTRRVLGDVMAVVKNDEKAAEVSEGKYIFDGRKRGRRMKNNPLYLALSQSNQQIPLTTTITIAALTSTLLYLFFKISILVISCLPVLQV